MRNYPSLSQALAAAAAHVELPAFTVGTLAAWCVTGHQARHSCSPDSHHPLAMVSATSGGLSSSDHIEELMPRNPGTVLSTDSQAAAIPAWC